MSIIYCRQPGGYYNNPASTQDGSEANPNNWTWAQIQASHVAGNTVRLHPSYLFDLAVYIETGTMICSGGSIERWDVPGFDWIFPTFFGLDNIPSGAWTNDGNGNWRAVLDGTLGTISRNFNGSSTALNATTNSSGYALNATVINLSGAGTGTFAADDVVSFAGDPNVYRITAGGSLSGSLTLAAPGLLQAIPASNTLVTVRSSPAEIQGWWGVVKGKNDVRRLDLRQ
jgi:hypothetical protein